MGNDISLPVLKWRLNTAMTLKSNSVLNYWKATTYT